MLVALLTHFRAEGCYDHAQSKELVQQEAERSMTQRRKETSGKQKSPNGHVSVKKKAFAPIVLDAEEVRPPKYGEAASPKKPTYIREYVEYSDDSLEVRRVAGRGYGLFARRRFRPAELVLRFGGQVVYGKDYSTDYCIDLPPCPRRGARSLEPNIPGSLINHSCDPNCSIMVNSAGHAFVVAECCIGPGTELTIDYAYPFVGEEQIVCQCRSDNCRGWIVAAEFVPRLKKLHASKNGKRR